MQVTQGKEMGFIKFGSRVDVYLPLGSDIKVELEQKVSAAETLLAVCKYNGCFRLSKDTFTRT